MKEYDIKLSTKKTFFLLLSTLIIFSAFNYYRSYPNTFASGTYDSWGGFENVVTSTLSFLLILHLDLQKLPVSISKIILKISSLSFGTYLLSYIVDNVIYPYFNLLVPNVLHRLNWYFIVVPLVFICALTLSRIVTLICKPLNALCTLIKTSVNK